MPDGTQADPYVTRHDVPRHGRRGAWCRCADCGLVARCTPECDYYDANGYVGLYCPGCFPAIAAAVVARWKVEEN